MSIKEFTKLPEHRFPPLIEYIQKKFRSKQKFLSFITEKTGIKILAKKYGSIVDEVCKKIGKQQLLSILNIQDEREAELRAYLYDTLYKGLTEAVWGRQLSPLYERITGKKVKIARKIDKRDPAYTIAFTADERLFTEAWIALYKEEVLPPTFQYGKLTVGALGWLISRYDRWEDNFSTVFDIIGEKFNQKSQNVILGNLLSVLEQVAKAPENELSKGLCDQLVKNLELVAIEKDNHLKIMKILQLIQTYLDDDDLCEIINRLIAEDYIEPQEVQKLYERFPYSFSDWVITPYGVFKQPPSWLRQANKELACLVEKEFDPKYLEPDLESYHGSYSLRILEYCIREDPDNILRKFGIVTLRKIAEKLGIVAALKVKDEEELVRLIILKLGFNLPPILIGLAEFNEILNKCMLKLRKGESLSSIMPDVYGETERVLQDIVYFYIAFLWKVRTRGRKPEEVEAEITTIVRNMKVSEKPFSKLTFGELIKLIRTLNKEVQRNRSLKGELIKTFDRHHIIPQDRLEILNKMSQWRVTLFAHKRMKEPARKPDRHTCSQIIETLKDFSKFVEDSNIYPEIIRVKYEVTNEYGTRYFGAVDDKGNEWTIEYRGLDPSKPYFMHSKTNPVAVDPIIIEKIF